MDTTQHGQQVRGTTAVRDPRGDRHWAGDGRHDGDDGWARYARHDAGVEEERWRERTRLVLEPIAAPSILGLYAFAGATFIVAAHLAGWYGSSSSALYLFPFAAFFGGLAQFVAGIFAYRARDAVATAMHGMWGSFWLAYGLLNLLFAVGAVTEPQGAFPELGYWFFALGAITLVGALAAAAENMVLFAVLGSLAAGAGIAGVGNFIGSDPWVVVAGYFFIVAAGLAFYLASAMMLEASYGRVVLPLGKLSGAANVPGRRVSEPIQREEGMPGARQGQ